MNVTISVADGWGEQDYLADAVQTIDGTREASETAQNPDSADRLRREIDELRERWTQSEAARGMKESYRKVASGQRIPRRPWFLASLAAGVSFPVVVGVLWSEPVVFALGVVLVALGAVTLLLDAVARARFESAQLQAEWHLERMHREAEHSFRQAAVSMGIEPDDIETELQRLEQVFEQMTSTRPVIEADALHLSSSPSTMPPGLGEAAIAAELPR